MFDSGVGDESRILIFATDTTMDLMEGAEHVFVDGTFKVVPELFFQLYTIHARSALGNVLPCAYVLLPNKTRETYNRMFAALKTLRQNLAPMSIMMDFEKAAMTAANEAFPNATISGCSFHLSQNIYRKVQSEGLQNQYANDDEFRSNVKTILSLAYVPLNEVCRAFEILRDEVPEELDPVMEYFEANYIGVPRRRYREQPRFKHSVWNMRVRIMNGLPRTNNHCEAFHRKLLSAVTSYHPNIWRFIDILRKEQSLNNVRIVQEMSGRNAIRPRRAYRELAQRITTLANDFPNRTIMDFLRGMSYNMA